MKKVQIITFSALFIAMEIILTRFLAFYPTPVTRYDLTYVAIALSAVLLGPVMAGLAGGAADIVGMFIVGSSVGSYFPGFTLSYFVVGVIFGIFLYKKEVSIVRIIIADLLVKIIVDLGMNTLWNSILYNKAFLVILATRIIKCVIMFPVEVILIYILWKGTSRVINTIINRTA